MEIMGKIFSFILGKIKLRFFMYTLLLSIIFYLITPKSFQIYISNLKIPLLSGDQPFLVINLIISYVLADLIVISARKIISVHKTKKDKKTLKLKIQNIIKNLDKDELIIIKTFISKEKNTLSLDLADISVRGLLSKGILFKIGRDPKHHNIHQRVFSINHLYRNEIEEYFNSKN